MKLYHYKFENGIQNFGDDLNAWLWEKLLPFEFDGDEAVVLVGIGTLLNNNLPSRTVGARTRLVFSTGVGYGTGPLHLDQSYRVYCVRGPRSATALNLPPDLGITDGAILIRTLTEDLARIQAIESSKQYDYAYMPHIENLNHLWQPSCQLIGFRYIDPSADTETILSQIMNTKVLITEAMHGAIVADALRIPWIAVTSRERILPFKWQDWCDSIKVSYSPSPLKFIYRYRGFFKRRGLRKLVHWLNILRTARQLQTIARTARPTLSDDHVVEELTEAMQEKLQMLITDISLNRV